MKYILYFLFICFIQNKANCEQQVLLKNDFSRHYQQAQLLISNNNLVDASKLYLTLFENDRENREYILHKLSEVYASRKKTPNYISFLQEKIDLEPFDDDLNLQLAEEYFVIDKNEDALERVMFVLASSPDIKEKTYRLAGEINFKIKKYDQCIQFSSKFLEQNLDSEILLLRAQCYLGLENYKKAQSDLNLYLDANQPSQKTYNLQAQIYLFVYDEKKMARNYQECLDNIPYSVECFSGYLKIFAKDNEKFCIQYFEKYQDQFQENAYILSEMSQLYSSYSLKKSEDLLKKLVNLDSKSFTYIKALFDHYKKTKQFQKAYDLIGEYLKENPASEEAIVAKQSLIKKNQIQLIPENEEVKILLNKSNIEGSNKPGATNLNLSKLPHDKARLLYENGQYRQSLDIVNKISPRTDKEYFRAGLILFNLNNLSLAIKNWSYIKKDSAYYYDAVINTILVMRMQNMRSAALKKINEIDFPKEYRSKVVKIKNLFDTYTKRVLAEEQATVNLQFVNLMNLDWNL